MVTQLKTNELFAAIHHEAVFTLTCGGLLELIRSRRLPTNPNGFAPAQIFERHLRTTFMLHAIMLDWYTQLVGFGHLPQREQFRVVGKFQNLLIDACTLLDACNGEVNQALELGLIMAMKVAADGDGRDWPAGPAS